MSFLGRFGVLMLCLLSLTACSQLGTSSRDDSSRPPPPDQIGGAKVFGSDEPQGYDPATIANPAWMPKPLTSMPYGSRVGIMVVLDNELAIVHAGMVGRGDYRHTYRPSFDLPGYVAESVRKGILSGKPYQPLSVRPSARLLRDKAVWQRSWNTRTQSFDDGWQQEFDAIIKQNRLGMLIVISAYEVDDGISGTSQTLLGNGLYNRKAFTTTENTAFSTLRFHRLVGTPAKLEMPVTPDDDRLYAELKSFPDTIPEPLPAPLRNSLEFTIQRMVDQKTAAFLKLMK